MKGVHATEEESETVAMRPTVYQPPADKSHEARLLAQLLRVQRVNTCVLFVMTLFMAVAGYKLSQESTIVQQTIYMAHDMMLRVNNSGAVEQVLQVSDDVRTLYRPIIGRVMSSVKNWRERWEVSEGPIFALAMNTVNATSEYVRELLAVVHELNATEMIRDNVQELHRLAHLLERVLIRAAAFLNLEP